MQCSDKIKKLKKYRKNTIKREKNNKNIIKKQKI